MKDTAAGVYVPLRALFLVNYCIRVMTFVHDLRQHKLLTATGKCNYIEK